MQLNESTLVYTTLTITGKSIINWEVCIRDWIGLNGLCAFFSSSTYTSLIRRVLHINYILYMFTVELEKLDRAR